MGLLFLVLIDQQKNHNYILNLRNSASDMMNMLLIHQTCIKTLVPPLARITNLSLTEGVFPLDETIILCSSKITDPYQSFRSLQNHLRNSATDDSEFVAVS